MTYIKDSIIFETLPTYSKFQNLTGQRFERLVVLGFAGGKPPRWWCECECGNIIHARASHLLRGNVRSCKCLARDVAVQSNQTHGRSKDAIYHIWQTMKARCSNPKHCQWQWYGGKGVKVCERWQNSFEAFLEDMGERPEGLTIDRIDTKGNYEPTNCKWSTGIEQANNTSTNHFITMNGVTMTIANWCRELHIDPNVVYCRLREKWDEHRALTTPVRLRKSRTCTGQP